MAAISYRPVTRRLYLELREQALQRTAFHKASLGKLRKQNTEMAEQRKAVIKNADMSETMQQDAVDVASVALSKYNIEKVSTKIAYSSRI